MQQSWEAVDDELEAKGNPLVGGEQRASETEPPLRVLVAEDDPAAAHMLEYVLTHSGFEVELARGGASAVLLAYQRPPDAALIALYMPGIGGEVAVRALRRRARPTGSAHVGELPVWPARHH
jgi:CheY-like chemotaxis protein